MAKTKRSKEQELAGAAMNPAAAAPETDSNEAILEAAPESERWNPVPGSRGHQAPETEPEDADDEGQNQSAQLAVDGAEEAARDQALRAKQKHPVK